MSTMFSLLLFTSFLYNLPVNGHTTGVSDGGKILNGKISDDIESKTAMPDRFSIKFTEFFQFPHDSFSSESVSRSVSTPNISAGHWHYDYHGSRWTYEHDVTTMSMFCEMNADEKSSTLPCSEHFLDDRLYIKYHNGTCCNLCGEDDCCSVLKPKWLTADQTGGYSFQPKRLENITAEINGNEGVKEVKEVQCQGYGRPGATTKLDAMYFYRPKAHLNSNAHLNSDSQDLNSMQDLNIPCRYYEDFSIPAGLKHNMTFDLSSFTNVKIPDSAFEVTDECKKNMCPTPFKLPSGYSKKDCPGHGSRNSGKSFVHEKKVVEKGVESSQTGREREESAREGEGDEVGGGVEVLYI